MTDQVMRWMPVSQTIMFHNSNYEIYWTHLTSKDVNGLITFRCEVNIKILIDKVQERQLNESLTVTIHDNEC